MLMAIGVVQMEIQCSGKCSGSVVAKCVDWIYAFFAVGGNLSSLTMELKVGRQGREKLYNVQCVKSSLRFRAFYCFLSFAFSACTLLTPGVFSPSFTRTWLSSSDLRAGLRQVGGLADWLALAETETRNTPALRRALAGVNY